MIPKISPQEKTMDVFWGTSFLWEILLLLEEIMQIYLDMEQLLQVSLWFI